MNVRRSIHYNDDEIRIWHRDKIQQRKEGISDYARRTWKTANIKQVDESIFRRPKCVLPTESFLWTTQEALAIEAGYSYPPESWKEQR